MRPPEERLLLQALLWKVKKLGIEPFDIEKDIPNVMFSDALSVAGIFVWPNDKYRYWDSLHYSLSCIYEKGEHLREIKKEYLTTFFSLGEEK